jgi:hypothetical protein
LGARYWMKMKMIDHIYWLAYSSSVQAEKRGIYSLDEHLRGKELK